MTSTEPLDLDEIETRAAHLYEYAKQTDEGDQLAGTDVPALLAEVRRLRDELATAHARLDATARLAGRQETKLRELGDPATVDAVSVTAAQTRTTGQREDDGTPRHEIWSPHCDDGCCR